MTTNVIAIFQGKVKQSFGMTTAMDKLPIKGDVELTLYGLQGDDCAEKKFHGGLERALHQYPSEHYVYWQERFGEQQLWQIPGVGENISSVGMLETNVFIGDRYQWGDAIIEVSQPRSPCFKLNKRWQLENFAEEMQANGRCGWLYRVINPGKVNECLPLTLIERPENAMTVAQVSEIFFNQPLCKEGLMQLSQQHALSNSWMDKVKTRLATNEVESWYFRLNGKP